MTTITDTVLHISIQIQRHEQLKLCTNESCFKMYPITVRFETHMCHCNINSLAQWLQNFIMTYRVFIKYVPYVVLFWLRI